MGKLPFYFFDMQGWIWEWDNSLSLYSSLVRPHAAQREPVFAVSEPAHLRTGARNTRSSSSPNAVRAISTDIILQTIAQHCRAPDLELTATCYVKLRLSLSLSLSLSLCFQIQTQNSLCFIPLSANYTLLTCSASASVAA